MIFFEQSGDPSLLVIDLSLVLNHLVHLKVDRACIGLVNLWRGEGILFLIVLAFQDTGGHLDGDSSSCRIVE